MIITFEQVSIFRRRRPVLTDVTFRVEGGLTVLMGVNGAGKSTLLQAVVGVLPHVGTITVGGVTVHRGNRAELARLIGFAPQTIRWPRRMTAVDVVELAARLRDVPARSARSAALEALARVSVQKIADRPLGSLSGGEHRRVTVAQALVHDPDVLVLDEPTSELDPLFAEQFAGFLKSVTADCHVVATTHSVDDAVAWGGRLGVVSGEQVHWRSRDGGAADESTTAADVRDFFRAVAHA